MGVYAHVMDGNDDFRCNCPKCGKEVALFQTKEGVTVKTYPEKIDFRDVHNFYARCDHCKEWIDFSRNQSKKKEISISDYKLSGIEKLIYQEN